MSTSDPKLKVLREHGALNLHPQNVTDSLFREYDFFDPQDLMQVKYEMLRRVRMEGVSITDAAAAFGFSRVAFYQIRKRLEEEGLIGLLTRKKGPKHAHKLSDEIMGIVEQTLSMDPSLGALALSDLVRDRFGISVHPRSIERALLRRQKKHQR
jgi:transposase